MRKCFFCGGEADLGRRAVYDGPARPGEPEHGKGHISLKYVCSGCFWMGQPDMDEEHARALLKAKSGRKERITMIGWNYDGMEITFSMEQYQAGGTAVESWMENGEPYARISVYMQGASALPEGQFYLKDWSENGLIAQAMIEEGLIELVKGVPPARSGHIVAYAYQFTEKGRAFLV